MMQSNRPRTIDRRTVLRGLGTAVALPILDAMLPARLLSAANPAVANPRAARPPLRMAFLYVPNGMHMPDWTPSREGLNYDLPRTLEAIKPYQRQINVLTGLTLDGAFAHGDGGGDHARSVAAFLTGAHPRKTDGADIQNGISVDQVAAAAVGQQTRFSSLELGLEPSAQAGHCDSGYSCAYASNMSWRSPTSPMAKEIDPGAVFDRLFAGQTVRETRKAKSIRDRYRKSVLDFVFEDAGDLKRVLPESDRRKLDEYLYSVRDVEKRFVGVEKLSLTEEGIPDYPRPPGVPREMSDHAKLMMDMIALAFQTDSTRILSFMFTNAGSNRGYPDLGVSEGHHDCSHHGKSTDKQQKIATINRFHLQQYVYLLERLGQIREADGTLLDNSMIVYGSGISDGDRHNHDDLPILLAGNAGGRINSGRHIRYPNKTPLCNLYLWMLQQMGVRTSKFGDSNAVLNNLA